MTEVEFIRKYKKIFMGPTRNTLLDDLSTYKCKLCEKRCKEFDNLINNLANSTACVRTFSHLLIKVSMEIVKVDYEGRIKYLENAIDFHIRTLKIK